jgi:predicted site-specific integrase-resolvase
MKANGELKPKKKLLKRRSAAAILDTSVSTLKRFEREGRLKPIRLGKRHVCYDAKQVEAIASAARRGEI